MVDQKREQVADSIRGTLLSRRGFLSDAYTGLMGVSLASLLGPDLLGSEPTQATDDTWRPGRGQTHFPAQAKRVVQIFCPGAASHMDLWEHKPSLDRYDGQPLPGAEDFVSFQGKNGNLMKSPWPFVACGESGKKISSMLPHLAKHVDDIAFVHSMTSKTNTHGPGCVFMNTGHATEGFPAPAPGSAMLWAAPTTRFLRTSRSPISGANRPTAKRTGATASCPLSIRRLS